MVLYKVFVSAVVRVQNEHLFSCFIQNFKFLIIYTTI